MKIPVVTGTGQRLDLDTDDYARLVLLPEACDEIDPRLWELFAQDRAPVSAETRTSPRR